ncbi:hypothetical protein [Agromyces atrinae]|uniref:Terminase n=1 Tax=Agromyces atrinae TaxID=592376 RepID=A0A4Q2M7N9_9MICO|nr:hypothetical protein [Agromyces atrinae]NYD65991.1 hypothetical protein [Agromyces atrinae]RXZ86323.1 hypothetical protein ESP50_11235 [Agromyces atrinae]
MVTTDATILREQASFDNEATTPDTGSSSFLTDEWDSLRSSVIPPRHVSVLSDSPEGREEFLAGAELLRFYGDRAYTNPTTRQPMQPLPQQCLAADAVNGAAEAGMSSFALLMPRRASKTSGLFALALGRCQTRENYLVAYTMTTTALKARTRFKTDIVRPLEELYPDAKTRPFQIVKAGGSECVVFQNGSRFAILPPKGESFRSDSWDLIIIDEAGEADPETTEDILAGALSTMDTRPDAMLIVTGTAAKFRDGNLLWQTLEDGRHARLNTGILEFSAPDSTTEDELDDWETAKALVLAAHPGVGVLTNISKVEERWHKLSRAQFAEEYLSIFGTDGAVGGFLDMDAWRKLAVEKMPTLPAKFGLAIATHPDMTFSSIVAAWRDRKGRACVGVLEHGHGIDWLGEKSLAISRKHAQPVVHDTQGSVSVEVEWLSRRRPKPRLAPQSFGEVKTAHALLVKEIERGNFVHFGQPMLDAAAAVAVKRPVGDKAWLLGRNRKTPADDITPMEAAALALRYYDATSTRQRVKGSA